MPVYNKLVRDRIPGIIEAEGKSFNTRILEDQEYRTALHDKVIEEVTELRKATTATEATEELADILEILYAIAEDMGVDMRRIESVRGEKRAARGGFSEKILLIDVED